MRRGRSTPITIKDVASACGVSVATVTRSLQNSPVVKPSTRQRVAQIAQQLGYQPDHVARALRTGRSHTFGVLVPSLMEAYWGEVVAGVEEEAAKHGYSVMVAGSHGDVSHENEMLNMLLGKRFDGIVAGGVVGELLTERGDIAPPLVLIEWESEPKPDILVRLAHEPLSDELRSLAEQRLTGTWFSHVAYDEAVGAAAIGEHLLELGHQQVAFVAGPPTRTCLRRLLGIRGYLESNGRRLHGVIETENAFEESRRTVHEYLRTTPDVPSALVCYSDVIAIGAIRAAREVGLDVPADLSVVGYDDLEVSSFVEPPLTTVRNPKRELGAEAVSQMIAAAAGTSGSIQRYLHGSLIVRGSTAASPRSPA